MAKLQNALFEFDERSYRPLEPFDVGTTIKVGVRKIFIPAGKSMAEEMARRDAYNVEIVNASNRYANAAQARINALVLALDAFGSHRPDCSGIRDETHCGCGFPQSAGIK